MLAVIIIAAAGLLPNQAEFMSEDVHLLVEINSGIYSYHITNLSYSKITKVEFSHHATYNFKMPKGWAEEVTSSSITSNCENIKDALSYKQKGKFSMRVSSGGAVLGERPVKITFQSGEIDVIKNVWAPIPEKRSQFIWILSATAIILIAHLYISSRSQRKKTR